MQNNNAKENPKVIIIGLDSVPPELFFNGDIGFADSMPFVQTLISSGTSGPLCSTHPPITIPSWITMTTGKSPAQLGIYGFRSRPQGTYRMEIVSQKQIKHPRLWDLAAQQGQKSVVVSVPPTYPPTSHPNIAMTSCFLTPSSQSLYASSAELKAELEALFGPYIVDVDDFRTENKHNIAAQCRALSKQHFDIFNHLIKTQKPEFAMIVDLGPDRFHHAMLGQIMPGHPKYDPKGPFAQQGRQYYKALDNHIQQIAQHAGPDTLLLVVSDHGVKPLLGAICINEWLIQNGYLTLKYYPDKPTPLSKLEVDWSKTIAWGEGGYHGRIFLNVKNREPQGAVPPESYETTVQQLVAGLTQICGENGKSLDNMVYTAKQLYGDAPAGNPPDITVYFDNLSLRSLGMVGQKNLFAKTNDTGPDDANHAQNGIFLARQKSNPKLKLKPNLSVADIFHIASKHLGITL